MKNFTHGKIQFGNSWAKFISCSFSDRNLTYRPYTYALRYIIGEILWYQIDNNEVIRLGWKLCSGWIRLDFKHDQNSEQNIITPSWCERTNFISCISMLLFLTYSVLIQHDEGPMDGITKTVERTRLPWHLWNWQQRLYSWRLFLC